MSAELLRDRFVPLVAGAIEDRVGKEVSVVYEAWPEMAVVDCGQDDDCDCPGHPVTPMMVLYLGLDCCELHRISTTVSFAFKHLQEGNFDDDVVTVVKGVLDELVFERITAHEDTAEVDG